MRPLLGSEGRAALRELVSGRPLFGFDFDGTLAPIVAQPDDARVPPAIATALARLGALAPVAVVTGRAVDDVRARLGFEAAHVVGNHGAEGGALKATPAAALDPARAALAGAQPALAAAGVVVEDKGLSIALHYRLARDRSAARRTIDRVVAGIEGPVQVFGGKCVLNLTPAGAPDKADALLALVAQAGCDRAMFFGDDLNDEAVFERAPAGWITVRVGLDGPPSAARFFVDGTSSVAPVLQHLTALLAAQRR